MVADFCKHLNQIVHADGLPLIHELFFSLSLVSRMANHENNNNSRLLKSTKRKKQRKMRAQIHITFPISISVFSISTPILWLRPKRNAIIWYIAMRDECANGSGSSFKHPSIWIQNERCTTTIEKSIHQMAHTQKLRDDWYDLRCPNGLSTATAVALPFSEIQKTTTTTTFIHQMSTIV